MGFMDKVRIAQEEAQKNIPIASVSSGVESMTLRETTISYISMNKADCGKMPLEGVTATVENGADLQSRFTVTRLALLGPFALALKKKKGGERYLTIEGSDFVWSMEVDRKKVNEAMKFASQVNNAAKKFDVATSQPQQKQESPIEEVKSLKELLDMGIITQEEFDMKKRELLGL